MIKPITIAQDFRVSATTPPDKLAGAIVAALKQHGTVFAVAVGPGAVNQLVKGIAIARGFVAPRGENLICWPGFGEIPDSTEGETTSIRFTIVLE